MDETWQNEFMDYVRKIDHTGKWIHQHFHDDRNRDPVDDKIRLDTDSRSTIGYLKALIDKVNLVRAEGELEPI